MKTWRLVSGIICCVLSAYIVFQSLAAGLLIAIMQSGDSGAAAGLVVAGLVLAGGIVSIVMRSGGVGGNFALTALFGFAALIAFLNDDVYQDLVVWGGWCAICGVIAAANFVLGYGEG